jgi:hypothetical protein
MTPTININGSSIDDLIDPRLTAMDHLSDAIKALKQVTPNGRDYPGDIMECIDDRAIHFRRLALLRDMREEIMSEVLYIKEQGQ